MIVGDGNGMVRDPTEFGSEFGPEDGYSPPLVEAEAPPWTAGTFELPAEA